MIEIDIQKLRKYAPILDFVNAMIERMEAAEKKYGDWRDISDESVVEHLESEIKEWQESWQDTGEMIDVSNLMFMLWCIYANPKSWQDTRHQYDFQHGAWPAYRYE